MSLNVSQPTPLYQPLPAGQAEVQGSGSPHEILGSRTSAWEWGAVARGRGTVALLVSEMIVSVRSVLTTVHTTLQTRALGWQCLSVEDCNVDPNETMHMTRWNRSCCKNKSPQPRPLLRAPAGRWQLQSWRCWRSPRGRGREQRQCSELAPVSSSSNKQWSTSNRTDYYQLILSSRWTKKICLGALQKKKQLFSSGWKTE